MGWPVVVLCKFGNRILWNDEASFCICAYTVYRSPVLWRYSSNKYTINMWIVAILCQYQYNRVVIELQYDPITGRTASEYVLNYMVQKYTTK